MRFNKVVLLAACSLFAFSSQAIELNSTNVTEGKTLKNAQLFNQWGCTGENISPELSWNDVPAGTKSFAVTMYDPDAPTGSGWWHWMVVNLPASTQSLPANSGLKGGANLPKGASMVSNDFGFKGFGGGCPPEGAAPHNYQITVYALDVAHLELPENGTAALAGYNIYQHLLGKAVLTAPTNAR
ncbi:PEBP family protein [Shewanella halifaxensis HAW-EB4]|uniref:PEBP family protein n=1 Tax=Shewanella halifaxensis (strain HAW-EB4) TaxID=458817 RepID=B0TPV2_SHEHH|nr:YbhB/YbcL family Raf kinase inhibitor-like protein [Shewanella halifaxensis]ABZ76231.1 PEBP family protein [Shewanella halifaxensis HAW-EB4]